MKYEGSNRLFNYCKKTLGGKVKDKEVGALLNLDPADITHWKKGDKDIRNVNHFKKLSDNLNVPIGELLDVYFDEGGSV